MKIGDLKEPYRSLAVKNAKNSRSKFSNFGVSAKAKAEHISSAFRWDLTPEGHDFWREVNSGLTPEIPKK